MITVEDVLLYTGGIIELDSSRFSLFLESAIAQLRIDCPAMRDTNPFYNELLILLVAWRDTLSDGSLGIQTEKIGVDYSYSRRGSVTDGYAGAYKQLLEKACPGIGRGGTVESYDAARRNARWLSENDIKGFV